MKEKSTLLLFAIPFLFTGCAIFSGLQTYTLPKQGTYETNQGAQLEVIQLNQNNIPPSIESNPTDIKNFLPLFQKKQQIYKLSSGDVLSIQLWAYPEITPPLQQDNVNIRASGYPIDPNGNVQLPLIGQIHVAGKTLAETNRYLRTQFAKYLKHPDVVVRVISYEGQRYFVNGQVLKSGQYTLNDQPISLYTALGQAGGIDTKTADNTNIQLIRNGQTYKLNTIELEKKGLSLHNLLIEPNDTIFVDTQQNKKLYVMGESSKNQALTLRDQGMTLSDVLGESEGINPYSASAARIYIMRTDIGTKKSKVYQLNLSNFGNLGLANQFAMQKNDIVYIDATGLTRWQRIVNQIVPFSSSLYNFDQVAK